MADIDSTDAPIIPKGSDPPDDPPNVDAPFESNEEGTDFRAFLSKPPSKMTLDELYTELKSIQGSRMSKQKKKKVRVKKEREAKWMVDLLNALPEPARNAISALPADQRKATLKKLAEELNKDKAAKAGEAPPETTVAKS